MLDRRRQLGVRVVVVGFARPEALERFRRALGLDEVLLLADPDRVTYAAFGFGRGSLARIWLDPRVWLRYATLLARGRRPAGASEDTLQLGGDVLVDAAGQVRWVYRSNGPEDRPSFAELEAAVRGVDGA